MRPPKSDTYTDRRGNTYRRLSTGIHVLISRKSDNKVPYDEVPFDITEAQVVDACNVEFGYELISALPYAYCLYQKGLLKGTVSGVDTDCLYYFSPDHRINPEPRSWDNMQRASGLPNIKIHRPTHNWNKFSPPPLKARYKNDRFVYDKPIICICNRVNVEWGKGVINYFDLPILEKLFKRLKKKYQIIYFNIEGRKEFYDGVEPVSIGDFDLARKHGIVIHDLHKENPEFSFNELQLMVMANSEAFITMNGGYSILASYMGGTNVIYSAECREIQPEINSFYRWYHRFGESRIIHADSYEKLLERVDMVFVKKEILVNILVRTHNRPNFFSDCIKSIEGQTHKNVRVIASADNKQTDNYLIPYKVLPVKVTPTADPGTRPDGIEYGMYFPHNLYWNELKKYATDGWVMGLDDDDCFIEISAIKQVLSKIESEDDLLLWKVKFGDVTIPSEETFGKNIVPKDISGIGFMCHSKHLREIEMEPFRRADYRLIKSLSEKLTVRWIDKVLTGPQDGECGMGTKTDKICTH